MTQLGQFQSQRDVSEPGAETKNLDDRLPLQKGLSCTVLVSAIQVPLHQPRRYFDSQKLEHLADSIKAHGILEPLLVRPLDNGDYKLVAGERRLRAAISVGLSEVPVTVRELTDEQALALALVENLQRADLNPIEETEGVLRLLALRLDLKTDEVVSLLYRLQNETRGKTTHSIIGSSQFAQIEAVFSEVGRFTWESFTVNRLPLLKLPGSILELVRSGNLAYTKAQIISRIRNQDLQESLLQQTLEHSLSLGEIRKRIRTATHNPLVESKLPQELLNQAYRRIQASKAWEDPTKWERVKELLQELSSLIGN